MCPEFNEVFDSDRVISLRIVKGGLFLNFSFAVRSLYDFFRVNFVLLLWFFRAVKLFALLGDRDKLLWLRYGFGSKVFTSRALPETVGFATPLCLAFEIIMWSTRDSKALEKVYLPTCSNSQFVNALCTLVSFFYQLSYALLKSASKSRPWAAKIS